MPPLPGPFWRTCGTVVFKRIDHLVDSGISGSDEFSVEATLDLLQPRKRGCLPLDCESTG